MSGFHNSHLSSRLFSRGNSAEWFHLKSLSVKPPSRSRMALRTAVNNIELLTMPIGFTFARPFIEGATKHVMVASGRGD